MLPAQPESPLASTPVPATSRAMLLVGVAGIAAWVLLGVAVGWLFVPSQYKEWYRIVRVLRPLDYLTPVAIMAAFLLDLVALAVGHCAHREMRRRYKARRGDHLFRIGLALCYANLLVAVGIGLVLLWLVVRFMGSDPDYVPR